MSGFSHHLNRIAPSASCVAIPVLLQAPTQHEFLSWRKSNCDDREEPTWKTNWIPRGRDLWSTTISSRSAKFHSQTRQSPAGVPQHLIPRIDIVYKSWGKGGFHEKYVIEEAIGEGSFGTVYMARSKAKGTYRAVKIIDTRCMSPECIRNEINALLNVDHPHIIKMIRYYEEANRFYLLFEVLTGPDLFDAIMSDSDKGCMSEYNASIALQHMLKALKYCHAKFMGHYDIKPENFMYRNPRRTNLKMIDLGTSTGFKAESDIFQGTPEYMAPEIYQGIYGPEADVWSCGVVLFSMLTGKMFYLGKSAEEIEQLHDVNHGLFIQDRLKWASEQNITSEAHSLLKQMLIPDRHMRITVNEILQHPFILSSYQWDLHDEGRRSEALVVLDNLEHHFRDFSSKPMLTRATMKLIAHLVAHNQDEATAHAMLPMRLAFRMLDDNMLNSKRTPADMTLEMTRREGIGELSVDALEAALQLCGVSIPGDLRELFQYIDADKDGYICFTDFLSATLPSSVHRNDNHFEVAFNFFDSDGDGFITTEDLINALGCKSPKERETCCNAMREVCQECPEILQNGAPPRLSFEHFLQVLRRCWKVRKDI